MSALALVSVLQRVRSTAGRSRGTALLVLAALLLACQSSDDDIRAELAEHVRASGGSRFGFHYQTTGTAVLDCALPSREFHVTVDRDAGTVELRRDSRTGTPLAVSTPQALLVHRSAFASGQVPTAWLSVPGKPGTAVPEDIRAALGVDASRYLLAEGVPADGAQTVSALIDAATTVTRIGRPARDLQGVDGYRLTIPHEAPITAPQPSPNVDGEIAAEVWIDADGQIRRILVSDTYSEAAGWALDFTPPARPMDVDPLAVTSIEQMEFPLDPRPVARCTL